MAHGLADPANVGAIVRNARALGAHAIAIDARAADPFLRRTATVDVVERVGPSVVNILAESVLTPEQCKQLPFRFNRPGLDTECARYLDAFYDPRARSGKTSGSGVIIDREGHVLTNAHVIACVRGLHIALSDGRVFGADVVDEVFVYRGPNPAGTGGMPALATDGLDVIELSASFVREETQAFILVNNLENTKLSLQRNQFDLKRRLTELDYQIDAARDNYERSKQLFEDKILFGVLLH